MWYTLPILEQYSRFAGVYNDVRCVMTYLKAILLGLVQGIAEFLPISSSGHLAIARNLLNMEGAGSIPEFFDVLLHLGTLVAVFVAYWRDICDMVMELIHGVSDLAHGTTPKQVPPARRLILLIIVGTVKYIPFASRSSLNSMLQLSGEIEEAAIIQDIPWIKRMTRIIIPIQKSSIISGFLLPFMTCLRELSLFMLLCVQGFILSTTLDYFDEMGLYAFSSGINLILIVTILVCNTLVNKITGASLDKGIGG